MTWWRDGRVLARRTAVVLLAAAAVAVGVRELIHSPYQIVGESILRVETTEKVVALTFDDGPWPQGTLGVLRVLRRMDAKATFFMVGYLIERYPEIVERVRRAGMSIGTHSWAHPYLTPFVDLRPHRQETEIMRPAELLRSRFGVSPTLFRPPGGSYDASVVRVADQAGMRVVRWDVDPGDFLSGVKPRRIASTVLHSVRPGSIVLLHDGGGDPKATIRALPRIIRGIRRMGLEPVAIEG
jgi:chitin deacetylase